MFADFFQHALIIRVFGCKPLHNHSCCAFAHFFKIVVLSDKYAEKVGCFNPLTILEFFKDSRLMPYQTGCFQRCSVTDWDIGKICVRMIR